MQDAEGGFDHRGEQVRLPTEPRRLSSGVRGSGDSELTLLGIPQRPCPALLWASQEVWSGLPLWVLGNWRFELNMTVERKTRALVTDQSDSDPEPWSALKGPEGSIQTLPSPPSETQTPLVTVGTLSLL